MNDKSPVCIEVTLRNEDSGLEEKWWDIKLPDKLIN